MKLGLRGNSQDLCFVSFPQIELGYLFKSSEGRSQNSFVNVSSSPLKSSYTVSVMLRERSKKKIISSLMYILKIPSFVFSFLIYNSFNIRCVSNYYPWGKQTKISIALSVILPVSCNIITNSTLIKTTIPKCQ